MTLDLTQADISHALAPSQWDLGNQVLYSLCSGHPRHTDADAIIAKFWLIGRSYAAAIERRRDAPDGSDEFYETTLVETIKNSGLDEWLDSLPKSSAGWDTLPAVVEVHKKLMNLLAAMTGLEKRSLASKYLHFHRPDLFFLYDSRAKTAVAKLLPRGEVIKEVKGKDQDPEYLSLCRRCQWLSDAIQGQFGTALKPRQIDKVLLRVAARPETGSGA